MKKSTISSAIRCVIASIALSSSVAYAGEIGPRATEKANNGSDKIVDLIVILFTLKNALLTFCNILNVN